ncbi:MAG: signal peptide peptidase SppA [Prevotella sp.]|jgi:protease-4|nr:signal peptide peptidase SppA [Prevotella sp.]MCH3986024.1 signal peptide peptidase SppA [Prevotella sp.]MCH4018241.1 signal peptide peptidase SppA [Prevotella sp.]MCH4100558.1 signal peptide peptidase SppA [Prevotella sp.]MCH4185599.1 signal peptide peptidase SppA [Prevotella sp.]
MKDFFKNVLATIAGIFGFGLVLFIFGLLGLAGIIASENSPKKIADNSVLVLNLKGTIQERVDNDLLSKLTGGEASQIGLNDLLSSIAKAKEDPHIKGIYIETGALINNYGTLQELRNALADFKKSGKWIIAYGDMYTQGAYYVASLADKIYLNPSGMIDIHGIGAQPMYIKDLAAKFGIHYQVIKVGAYKSATEAYTSDRMSKANRIQLTAIINGTWKTVVNAISASRHISRDSINAYADHLILLADAKSYKKDKLVDGFLYDDEVKNVVKKQLGLDKDQTISQVSPEEMDKADRHNHGGQVAVYYAEGEIVLNNTASNFVSQDAIVSTKVCKDLEKLKDDDDVKAVVIRLNSPGGDAYASEQIWHAVTELKAKKPVVISMGDLAASGGYYMSCNANWIVAQPTTLTGSIGIFGVFRDLSELGTKKLGLHFDQVETNKHSIFGDTWARPLDTEELRLLAGNIHRGYQLFRSRVAQGRKMTIPQVERIAQGHVWLGMDAIKLGLVDQLGGTNVAVAKAARLAHLKTYHTKGYPQPGDWTDRFMKEIQHGNNLDESVKAALGDYYEPFLLLKELNTHQELLQARMINNIQIR